MVSMVPHAMNFHGFNVNFGENSLCLLDELHGFSQVRVGFYGLPWVLAGFHGFPRVFIGFLGADGE